MTYVRFAVGESKPILSLYLLVKNDFLVSLVVKKVEGLEVEGLENSCNSCTPCKTSFTSLSLCAIYHLVMKKHRHFL